MQHLELRAELRCKYKHNM